jgi:glycosyltransferase involved in cell wall biosynthesis
MFRSKIRRVVKDILSIVDPSSFDLAHAHFLYSDGAVARVLHERFGLPYIVAVRNTDVNVFMRFRPDLRWRCWDIVAHARHVVFLSPAYLDVLLRRAPTSVRANLAEKARVIPNGLSSFWMDQRHDETRKVRDDDVLKLLYVGELSKNKNIVTSITAAALLNRERPTTLTLVGAGGDAESAIDAVIASGKYPFVSRLGRVDDPSKLAAIYRDHDVFVMPSFRETFGVAYIEALSQGLPIVFSRGQGVDGYFEPRSVGEPVDPHDVGSIRQAISSLAENLHARRARCVAAAGAFAWPGIAESYVGLYRAISVKASSAKDR